MAKTIQYNTKMIRAPLC